MKRGIAGSLAAATVQVAMCRSCTLATLLLYFVTACSSSTTTVSDHDSAGEAVGQLGAGETGGLKSTHTGINGPAAGVGGAGGSGVASDGTRADPNSSHAGGSTGAMSTATGSGGTASCVAATGGRPVGETARGSGQSRQTVTKADESIAMSATAGSSEQHTHTSIGGAAGVGGASTSDGTTATSGTPTCSCTNPHPPSCNAACVEGVCKITFKSDPSNPGIFGLAPQSGPKDAAPRSGVWSSNNIPYLVYPSFETTPVGMRIQALDANGATAAPKSFDLPTAVTNVDSVATAMNGSQLGILWHGERNSDGVFATEFSVASLDAMAASPIHLGERSDHDLYKYDSLTPFVFPLGSTRWALVEYGSGNGDYLWSGYGVDTNYLPSTLPLTDPNALLMEGPQSITPKAAWKAVAQAAAVVNGVLFVTGYDQNWYDYSSNRPRLIVSRYDVDTLAALTPTRVPLSLSSYSTSENNQRTPVLGKLGSRLAAFWTEYTTSGAILLGKALFDTDNATAVVQSATPSDLIPKAMIETPSGAVMLVASRIDLKQSPPMHTVVVQRFDAELNLVGPAYPINLPSSVEPVQVLARPSTDGRVLITFRQDYAQHRIVHADFCQ